MASGRVSNVDMFGRPNHIFTDVIYQPYLPGLSSYVSFISTVVDLVGGWRFTDAMEVG